MENKDLIFKDEFLRSKEFKEWHEAYVSVVKHAMEPANDFIRDWRETFGKPKESKPITEDDPWFIKTKEEIITLKMDLIIKSIELGLYFKRLKDKENHNTD